MTTLFENTWSQANLAWGQDLEAMGVIIVIVEPLRKFQKSAWPMNCQKYLKTRANIEGFSTLTPQTDPDD